MLLYLEKPCQRNEHDEGPDAHVRTKRPNGKADRQRTIDSALPLDFIRRLIQRLVLATSHLRPRQLGVVVGDGRLFCRQQHLAAGLL